MSNCKFLKTQVCKLQEFSGPLWAEATVTMSAKTKKIRPLLVFINPASGTKLAGKMFRTIVQPRLDERHLTYTALETEYAGHAEELVMSTGQCI